MPEAQPTGMRSSSVAYLAMFGLIWTGCVVPEGTDGEVSSFSTDAAKSGNPQTSSPPDEASVEAGTSRLCPPFETQNGCVITLTDASVGDAPINQADASTMDAGAPIVDSGVSYNDASPPPDSGTTPPPVWTKVAHGTASGSQKRSQLSCDGSTCFGGAFCSDQVCQAAHGGDKAWHAETNKCMAWSSSTISALRDISLERTASGEERLCVSGTCAAVVGGKAKWPNMTGYHGSTTNVFPKVNWLADYADFSCPYCQVVGGSSATISGAHVALEASAASDWGAPNCGLVPADKWKLDISLDADLITLAP